jgi:exonuclease III
MLAAVGYHAIVCGQGPHHGVAILARNATPLETRRALRYPRTPVSGI